jgi:hypothetical protein
MWNNRKKEKERAKRSEPLGFGGNGEIAVV